MLQPNVTARPNQNPHAARPAARAAKPQFRASLAIDGALEMLIYGDIVDAATISMLEAYGYPTDGFISSLNVKRAMDSAGAYSRIRLRINSPGGDAFEGMAIHSLLSTCGKPVDVFVDGIAASSASIIAMVGSTRTMGRVSMLMIHDAWSCCIGNMRDMAKMGDTLGKIDESIAAAYTARTGKSQADMMAMMDAETWLTSQDCVDQGFATGIVEQPAEEESAAMAMARGFKVLGRMKKVPENLRNKTNDDDLDAGDSCECDCQACMDGDCANCSSPECDNPNCVDCPMQSGSSAAASAIAELPAPVTDDVTSLKRARLNLAQRRRTA